MFRSSDYLKLVLLILCGTFFATCTKDLGLDSNDSQRKLIINGRFAANQNFKIALTTSRNILDPKSQIEQVSDAYVAIKNADGRILEVLQEYNDIGVYVSSDSLKAYQGVSYHLEVTHPRWKDEIFTASSSAPEISSSSIIDTSHTMIGGKPALKIGVLVDDLENLHDKYVFEVELKEMGVLAPLRIDNSSQKDIEIFGDKEEPTRLFLGDETFNGEQRDIDFFTTKGLPSEDGSIPNDTRITEIRLLNVSAELFEYYKSLEEYEVAKKTIGTGNSSSVRIYSNIKKSGVNNGLGIFAGYNVKSLSYSY